MLTPLRPVLLPLGIFLASLLLWGASTIPGAALASMAQQAAHPWQDWGQATYHWETPLWLLLCGWVGATTVPAYTAFSAAVNVLAVLVACGLAWRAWGRLGALLVLAHPITYVLLTWIGLEDGLLVMCTAVLVWCWSPWALGFAAGVGVLVHPAWAFIWFGVGTLRVLTENFGRPHAVGVGIGLIAGILTKALLTPAGFHVADRLAFILARPALEWLTLSGTYLPLALYSFGFALWVPLVLAVRLLWLERRAYCVVLVGYLVGCAVLTAFTLDTTRVFALLTWGPVLHGLWVGMQTVRATSWGDLRYWNTEAATWAAAYFGFLAPRLCVWAGQVKVIPWLEWVR